MIRVAILGLFIGIGIVAGFFIIAAIGRMLRR